MGVNAAEAAQAIQIAAQMQLRQRNRADGADGDLQHAAVPAQVHQHLPVDQLGKAHQHMKQFLRQEQIAVKAGLVQRLQLPQVAVAYAFQISVDHRKTSVSASISHFFCDHSLFFCVCQSINAHEEGEVRNFRTSPAIRPDQT